MIPKVKPEIRSDYLRVVYDIETFQLEINRAEQSLHKFYSKYKFDAIAFTGTSGAAFAYPLSLKLSIPLICIRKDLNCHYSRKIEGYCSARKYIIVDDVIDTGNTIKTIKEQIASVNANAKLVGIYLYNIFNSASPYNKSYKGMKIINNI